MLLRIEDTDRERSTDSAIQAILDGLKWLGIDWDGDVVYQFSRAARHREVAESLLAQGRAYYCYATQQELEEMREKARAEGRPMRYDGRWRDRDPSEAPAGVKPVIRLKAPQDGETIVEDRVQGRVVWQNKDLDDLVLLRSDGNADLHARRRRRRPRHGGDARHPRRRPPDQRRPADADLPGLRMGGARDGAHPPDPRPRRSKALQAPWRPRRRRLPLARLSAGGPAQLPRAPRLEPWRPGVLHDAGDDRRLRLRGHRPLARALRLRQARTPQRPLHARGA